MRRFVVIKQYQLWNIKWNWICVAFLFHDFLRKIYSIYFQFKYARIYVIFQTFFADFVDKMNLFKRFKYVIFHIIHRHVGSLLRNDTADYLANFVENHF